MTSVIRVLAVLTAAGVGFFGCPASRPMQVPPSASPPVVSDIPAGQGQAASESSSLEPAVVKGGRADGAACFSSENCLSNICEGASCDSSRPGTCVPKERMCTSDLVEYCGCDGKTFLSSSTCPGESFSARGACTEDAAAGLEDASDEAAAISTPETGA